MKKVYFLLSAGWGPVVRTLPIADALKRAGVETFFHVGGAVGSAFEKAGHVRASPDNLPQVGSWVAARDWWDLDHYLGNLGWADATFVAGQFDAYRRVIEEIKPDALVLDLHLPGSMVARCLGIPTFSMAQSTFLPWRKWQSIVWWKEPPPNRPSATAAINEVLLQNNGKSIARAEDLQVGTMTGLPSFPEFDPLDNPPDSVVYLGPILADAGNRTEPKAAAEAWDTVLYPGRPKDSSGISGQAILDVALPALKELRMRSLVARGAFDYQGLDTEDGMISSAEWFSLLQPSQPYQFLIHHGGHGTCLTSLLAGVPSLVLPTFAEREYNARNLAALHCAEYLSFEDFSVDRVKEALTKLRDEPSYREHAEYWRDELHRRQYGGTEHATAIVKSLLH